MSSPRCLPNKIINFIFLIYVSCIPSSFFYSFFSFSPYFYFKFISSLFLYHLSTYFIILLFVYFILFLSFFRPLVWLVGIINPTKIDMSAIGVGLTNGHPYVKIPFRSIYVEFHFILVHALFSDNMLVKKLNLWPLGYEFVLYACWCPYTLNKA